jgi:hypothetical protein
MNELYRATHTLPKNGLVFRRSYTPGRIHDERIAAWKSSQSVDCLVWGSARPSFSVCLVALLGLSSVASAKPGAARDACPTYRVEANASYTCAAEFTLHGSNGYRITVAAEPEGRPGDILLSAESHAGNVQYSAPAVVSGSTIKARFGKLGRVSVRFDPSGRKRNVKVPKKCMKGRPSVVTSRLGAFVGTIEFRGEHGYTRVSAHSARGGIGDPLANVPQKLQCDFRESSAEHKLELESVGLDGSPPGAGISFDAFRLFGNFSHLIRPGDSVPPPGGWYLFLALSSEKVGPMSILRTAGALGESRDFVFDSALTTATIAPPRPFTGSGYFLRNADGSTSWTGSLAVPLPGLGTVGLTEGKADLETVATRVQRLEEEFKEH